MMVSEEITIRPFQSFDDYQQCVALQYETWGEGFGECVPPSILMATQKVAGVAAGAFDGSGRLLGFVFGLSGLVDRRPAHWSDMLAVRGEARGSGLGVRLKAFQRQLLLDAGIEVAYWTYDPLEARNAHINLNRLGARPIEYIRDMYGDLTGSALHRGLATDRFVVEWPLSDPRVEAALAGVSPVAPAVAAQAPIVNSEIVRGGPEPRELELVDLPALRVEIPSDIQALKRDDLGRARDWQGCARRALVHYMERGHRVSGFRRDPDAGRCYYLLEAR